MTSIVEMICEHAKQRPEKAAVIFEGNEVSYAELWNKTVRLAHLFKKLGVPDGSRIICQCKYDPYYVASLYAAHLCGAASIPVDKDSTNEMIANLYEQLDACLVVSNNKDRPQHSILYDELEDILSDDTSMDELSFPDPESIAEMMFTTGTTGTPKGVQLSQKNLTARVLVRIHEYGDLSNNICITLVPLNHVAPTMLLDLNLYCGSTMIFLDGMTKIKLMFDYMDKYGVTSMYIPPTGITLLQQLARNKLAAYTDQLDFVNTGSAPMTKAQQEYMKQMLPHTRLFFCYASSESGFVSLYRYDLYNKDITCCGQPCVTVDLRIVDENDNPVPAGQIGLLEMKSDMTMPGYYKLPELNREVFHNGYFVSSDLGYIDEDGFLFVSGRKDDIINIGGLKVYPSEIENAALRIPGIEECICFGTPDPITGQSAKLLIKPGDSFTGSVTLVKEELSKVMDYYKVPKNIEIVSEIAKTANGKLNRKFYQNQIN